MPTCLILLLLAASPPATAPSENFSTLINQLGDDDFSVREAASAKLLQAGPAAKGALQQAASSPDPERKTRAAELLRRLTIRPLPGEAPPGLVPNNGVMLINRHDEADGHIIEMTVGGRTTHIEQGANGANIKMTVHGYINGQRVTEEYDAANPAELKALSPDAYKLWLQLGGTTNRMFLNQGNNVMVLNNGLAVVGGGDDIGKLSENIVRQMLKTKLTEAQRLNILQEIQRVRLAKEVAQAPNAAVPMAMGNQPAPTAQDAYLKECDELRKQLAAAGLPDPGPALPPPAKSRLGVTISDAPGIPGAGMTIVSVEDASRGKKLGLLPGDLIHDVNGRPITSTADLRTAVTNNPHLELSVTRAGQEIILREPAAAAGAAAQ